MRKKERFDAIIQWFEEHMPIAETELHYSNPFELLVAVILSSQCTDKRVNMLMPSLLAKYPDEISLSQANVEDVFSLIRSCSYPNNKAKHLVGMAKMLHDNFKGEMPSDINELQKMPGVGRKTANVIASVVFNKPAMAVDTHVFRVSERLGLTYKAKTPLEAEKQLVKYIPEEKISIGHHWLILHGRYVCTARTPKCPSCGLKEYCKYFVRKNQSKG